MSIYDTPKPNIYDTPRSLKPNLLKKNDREANDHVVVSGNNIDIGSNPGKLVYQLAFEGFVIFG